MEQNKKKGINYCMRVMHRNVGYLIVGFVVIFVISGILQIYRDTDFMKKNTNIVTTIEPNLSTDQLARALHIKEMKVKSEENGIVYFENGMYNSQTGEAKYVTKQWPFLLHKMTELHTTPSRKGVHYFTLLFAMALLFMVVSSFWMYRSNSEFFKKGMINVFVGILAAIFLLLL